MLEKNKLQTATINKMMSKINKMLFKMQKTIFNG